MDQIFGFIEAYIHLGAISRRPAAGFAKDAIDAFGKQFYIMHFNSNRQASKSRDYVFAVMTQFKWYHPPKDAENLDFNTVFLDLYHQSKSAGHPFTSRINQSMIDSSVFSDMTWMPNTKQPEPKCLGDFLKPLGHRALPSDVIQFTNFATAVSVHEISMTQALELIFRSMSFSNMAWCEAFRGGTLSQFGSSSMVGSLPRTILERMQHDSETTPKNIWREWNRYSLQKN